MRRKTKRRKISLAHCIDIMRIIQIETLFLVNINKKYSEENETSAQFYIILNYKMNKCSLTLTLTVTVTDALTKTPTLKITIAVLTVLSALLVN